MTEPTAALVRDLVAGQFPRWAGLPVTAVEKQGNDNRTFRLGGDLAVRLPSGEGYVAGITKENAVLPILADHLSVAIPAVVATGRPTADYPFPWSVRRWLAGSAADTDAELDRPRLARDVGAFLRQLRGVPAQGGPAAGEHSFYRGCHPSVYGDQVQQALADLRGSVDAGACERIWQDAIRTVWDAGPVWFHGDVAADNLLTASGRLAAVIDFGTCGVGDPACDLVLAWTFLSEDERRIFRDAVALPRDTWVRARGWALWKALISIADRVERHYETQSRALAQILADPIVE